MDFSKINHGWKLLPPTAVVNKGQATAVPLPECGGMTTPCRRQTSMASSANHTLDRSGIYITVFDIGFRNTLN
jgi:hypothetical protein